MTNIAILGFGVVGGGVADLISKNYDEVKKLGGDDICIKHILDLREFPGSPFADRVTKDFNKILSDGEVSVIIEAMGGSHPAYEYTVAACWEFIIPNNGYDIPNIEKVNFPKARLSLLREAVPQSSNAPQYTE